MVFARHLLPVLLGAAWPAAAENPAAVFQGPAAAYEPAPPGRGTAAPEVLRWVWVEERMAAARAGAPVRVPVFLGAGECRDPAELTLVRWPAGPPAPVQADDVRRGPDGGVARLHLWFTTDLAAGETQRWALVRGRAPAPPAAAVAVAAADGKLRVSAAGTEMEFLLRPAAGEGALRSLRLARGPRLEFPDGAGGHVTGPAVSPAGAADPAVAWGGGPVFAKVRVTQPGPEESRLTADYRIFSDGSVNLAQTLAGGATGVPAVTAQDFLRGRLVPDAALQVRPLPAGLADPFVDFHPGYAVDALFTRDGPRGWLVMPGALGGGAGRVRVEGDAQFRLQAPGGLDPARLRVQGYWSEVTLRPVDRADDGIARPALRAAAQPLVAVVEHPQLSLAAAVARLTDNLREMKPVGWVNQMVTRELQDGPPAPFPRRKWRAEADAATWLDAARKAANKVQGGENRPLREDEKGRAAGPLDPYQITYGSTPLAAWLWRGDLPPPARDSLRAQLAALRTQLGRTDAQGWPYLDVFNRTQNMQTGPALLALADAGADPALRQFYRDLLAAPVWGVVLPRGMRPYEGRPQAVAAPSDTIYQAVVDFMLRAAELSAPGVSGPPRVAYGRYLDAVDVNADLLHPAHPRRPDTDGHFARANFFRAQSHLHRWLAWGPAPFLALAQRPRADGATPGATEAWYFADMLAGQWKNWPDQSWLYLATVLPARAAAWPPVFRPAAIRDLRIESSAAGNSLGWQPVPGAAAYRVHRSRSGGPPVWLNSPYTSAAPTPLTQDQWRDPAGRAGDRYWVQAVDAAGIAGAWGAGVDAPARGDRIATGK